jgi:hypothetical protein
VNRPHLHKRLQSLIAAGYEVHLEYPLGGGRRADIALVRTGVVEFIYEVRFSHRTHPAAREGFHWIEVLADEILVNPFAVRATASSSAPKPVPMLAEIPLLTEVSAHGRCVAKMWKVIESHIWRAYRTSEIQRMVAGRLMARRECVERMPQDAERIRLEQIVMANLAKAAERRKVSDRWIAGGILGAIGLVSVATNFKPPRHCPRNWNPLLHVVWKWCYENLRD